MYTLVNNKIMKNLELNTNWYVAYTYPKAEKKVEKRVREMGIDAYLPLKKVQRVWSDRVKTIEQPLFSNYIFIKTIEGNIPRLVDLHGIAKFISFGKRLAIVKEKEIEMIKKALSIGKEICIDESSFKEGRKVMVKQGPFAGLKGALVRKQGKNRFMIEIESLSRSVGLDIPVNYLQMIG